MNKPRVLFLCTHNSARSQMAEGYYHNHRIDVNAVQVDGR